MTLRNALALSLCALALASCKKRSVQPESAPREVAVASTDASANRTERAPSAPASTRYRRPAAERIVAVGDLHGDLLATEQVLRLAGALGPDRHWAGGKLVLVQTGDQLDRGGDEKEILDLFEQLKDEAGKAGGAFIALNGNHETMNALGDFRYVTEDAIHDFDALAPDSPRADQVPVAMRERAAAFLPGGSMALRLATRPVVVQVGETLFVHGGLKPEHVRYGLDRMNDEVAVFLRGGSFPPAWMVDDQGPLWTRIYGTGELDSSTCGTLARALAGAGAKRLVIGHTIQDSGISSACDGRVFRIDVGMSSHYRGNLVQALLLRGDQATILSTQKE